MTDSPAAGAPAAVVLVNRRARQAADALRPAVRDALASRYTVVLHAPDDAAATTRLAREAADAGAALVVAAGGDGTARAVAQALVDRETALGLLPVGTANDLARALGVPRDPLRAAARLAAGTVRSVDVVDADGAIFCTAGGLGLVSRSALLVPALKARGRFVRGAARAAGASIYKLTATAALLAHGGARARLAVSYLTPQGARHDEVFETHGVFVVNQRFTGGGLALPGDPRDDDGAFELCVVLPATRARLLDAFARLTLGLPIPDRALAVLRAREAHLVSDREDVLLGDGDRLAAGRIFHLRARARALRVVV